MLADTTLEEYRRVTEINQIGMFLGMKAVYGPMCAAGGGSVVNISSVDGSRARRHDRAYWRASSRSAA